MKRNYFYVLALILLLSGCYPEGAEYYHETDVVYTNYEEDYNFTGQKTYAMPDKIVKITKDLIEGEEPEFVEEPYNTQILNKIEENMTSKGYTQVLAPEDADLFLMPAVWTNTTIYYWYDYWCWYNPWFCDWGWYYPPVTSVTTGTLVMSLIDDGDEYVEPYRVWTGLANGLLSGVYSKSRVDNAIDQAFKQSPYLKTN